MSRSLLWAVAGTAIFAVCPAFAQSDTNVPSSGGAGSPVYSGGAASEGAGSQAGALSEMPPTRALPPGGAAGTNQAGSLSTVAWLGVGAGGVIVGVLLVTLNHGSETVTTTAPTP